MNPLEQNRGIDDTNEGDSAELETIPRDPTRTWPEAPSARQPIRVLVVEAHPVVGPGISACLAKLPNITSVTYATEGRDALCKARTLRPDIVVTGLDKPRRDRLDAINVLLRRNPEIKVLILSVHGHVEIVLRSLESGAQGYVLKNAPPQELVRAIETVYGGDVFFRKELAQVAP